MRPIKKRTATTLRRNGMPLRRETWEAETVDGEWDKPVVIRKLKKEAK